MFTHQRSISNAKCACLLINLLQSRVFSFLPAPPAYALTLSLPLHRSRSMPLSRVFFTLSFSLFSRTLSSLLFSSSSLHAHHLLRYSPPTLSLVLFSHSPHSHASPSTALTLPHASSFPFSRFPLHLFALSLAPLLHSLLHRSLRSLLARYLKLYFILLFGITSIHLFFQLPTSRFTSLSTERD